MHPVRLPYIDNAKAVLITLAINLGVVFLLNWPGGVTYSEIVWDSLFCAVITTTINLWIVYYKLKKLRAAGDMPAQTPESAFMQRLPQNPFALGAIYAAAFAAFAIGVNTAILWFFGIWNMAFAPWVAYKLIYATLLSVKIVEYCIFRYTQPDWAKADHGAKAEAKKESLDKPVKNPLPKIGVFKEMYGSVAGNIALNIIIGSILGSVTVKTDGSVVILPTTAEGISITGLVFGLITGILVTNGMIKAMRATIIASGPAISEGTAADKRLTWMPKGKFALVCFISLCLMLFSAATLRAVMVLFDLQVLNFCQFVVFITVYAAIISKPLAFILTKRCMQPDYIRYTLKKANVAE